MAFVLVDVYCNLQRHKKRNLALVQQPLKVNLPGVDLLTLTAACLACPGTKLSDKFSGVVCEIVSGDCIVVRDKANGQERRVNLSSIKAPRLGRKEEKPEPWAPEAKEFLRQRLIGRLLGLLGYLLNLHAPRPLGTNALPGKQAVTGKSAKGCCCVAAQPCCGIPCSKQGLGQQM